VLVFGSLTSSDRALGPVCDPAPYPIVINEIIESILIKKNKNKIIIESITLDRIEM